MSSGPERDEVPPDFDDLWREFEGVFGLFGLSPDRPADGYKLAFWLYVYLRHTRLKAPTPKQRGRKATEAERDAIILAVVEIAKRQGDKRGVGAIIRAFAKANGWRADEVAIKSKRRRYQDAKKRGSPINRRMGEALQSLQPWLECRVQQPERLQKSGLTPHEIEEVMDRIERAKGVPRR
jgi:hypothetical protein